MYCEQILTSMEIYGASVSVWAGLMTERRLGDVKLKELFSWLGARTPKSPKETVTMFNKGLSILENYSVRVDVDKRHMNLVNVPYSLVFSQDVILIV